MDRIEHTKEHLGSIQSGTERQLSVDNKRNVWTATRLKEQHCAELADLRADGKWHEAIRLCRRILRLASDDLGTLEILAQLQWQVADCKGVLATTKRLLRLNPYEPGYLYLQGMAYQTLACYGDASRSFQRAASESGNDTFRIEVRQAISHLDTWQSDAVQRLIETDAEFRQRFLEDPNQALEERGFQFSWSCEEPIRPAFTESLAQRRRRIGSAARRSDA